MPEVWGTRLTLGLVKSKLDEHGLIRDTELRRDRARAATPSRCGPFRAEFVRVTHSIPDAVAVALHTAQGTIVHTGDFKLDHTPIDGAPHRPRAASRGSASEGVDAHARPTRRTPSARASRRPSRSWRTALRRIIRDAPGRVIVTSFASHIHRLQEVIDAAEAAGGGSAWSAARWSRTSTSRATWATPTSPRAC